MAKSDREKLMETKLTLSNSALSNEQLNFMLGATPKKHIYKRPGKGGKQWEYVTGVYVKKVLNFVFGWDWDLEVKEHGVEGNSIWVLGRLTVRTANGTVIKEQFGRADIKKTGSTNLDFGNDLKAATTDALKKCASELGIASDIYGKEEFKSIEDEGNSPEPPVTPVEDRPSTENQIATISKLAEAKGVTVKPPKTFDEASKLIKGLSTK